MYNQFFHVLKCSDETMLALLKVRSLIFLAGKKNLILQILLHYDLRCALFVFMIALCTIFTILLTYTYIFGANLVNKCNYSLYASGIKELI